MSPEERYGYQMQAEAKAWLAQREREMTEAKERPAHSPLGASSAERWMNCPGSVALINRLKIDEHTDEPDYRKEGTAAHEAAAHCLTNNMDAWEIVGEKFNDVEVGQEMADAIQIYLDTVRADDVGAGLTYTEYSISDPDHPFFYGTCDRGRIDHDTETLIMTDFKYGEGIQVDPEHNPQLMYYAYGMLMEHSGVTHVKLRIVQPRGFHHLGPVREWETTAEAICEWAESELFPAMAVAQVDTSLDSGEWCRFCPAKLVCPMLVNIFKAVCQSNPKTLVNVSDESLGRDYQYVQAAKFFIKALDDEIFRRLNVGRKCVGTKLVYKKANRVFRDGAEKQFSELYGDLAYTPPKLLSPAEMEKLDSKAKDLVRELAYTPQNGLTVALEKDKRVGVVMQTTAEAFGAAIEKLTGESNGQG